MAERIHLTRKDNTSWGFRVTGGLDFGAPLSVIRLIGGSIAEKAGLRVGDVITSINGADTRNMTHNDVQRCILIAGNFLTFDVLRGSPVVFSSLTPARGMTPASCPDFDFKRPTSTISVGSFDSFSYELIGHNFEEEKPEPTEEEIAQMLLENAEVLEEKGKNVIGVNFNRFIPKCEFIKDSAVFQVLQEEQVYKEMSEKEQLKRCPNKRFSTFLAIPNRPILKPKMKNTKESDLKSSESERIDNDQSGNVASNNAQETSVSDESEEKCNSTDISIQGVVSGCNNIGDIKENYDATDGADEQITESDPCIDESVVLKGKDVNEQDVDDTKKDFEIEDQNQSEFDKQLAEIKSKLDSLQQLPSMIELHLNQVQAQIDNLIRLKTNPAQKELEAVQPDRETTESCDVYCEDETNEELVESESPVDDNEELNDDDGLRFQDPDLEKEIVSEEKLTDNIEETNINEQESSCESSERVETSYKKRPIYPLTPMPRPVVLPGGRRWRGPKDAFNEQFIAETLISQAEVLLGSTLGVNFRKYEPPKFDLSNSAVYKLVHDIESNAKGIANRPEIVPAEQDYYQSPINARHFYLASLCMKSQERNSDSTVDL